MNLTFKQKFLFAPLALLACGALLFTSMHAFADVSEARDMAYRIGSKLRDRGFTLFPGDHGDNSKQVQEFEFPVTKGLDYAFLVASDALVVRNSDGERKPRLDIDLYIEDENGTHIVADTRLQMDAFVEFTSQYNGTAKAKLVFATESGGFAGAKLYQRFFFLMGVRGDNQFVAP